ncbi:unnamed protein product [Litomosoides sigmodontis]|uniref:Chitin-binding type-2 domain-containing protein n=1 Tax=Litomosoides sigmodontis TaxID=42156 RepID=A0A3P6SDI1_LITSI|nr:unnamed protein product [Litomosoides sigmodontis]
MCVIVLFVFLTIANAQSERENKALMNSHLSQNSQPFQQSRDTDGSIVISGNQQFIIHRHNRTATACNPGDIAPTGNDCIAYYECIDGYYKLRFCPSNTFFDPALKRCHASYVCPKRSYELRTSSLPPCKHGELRGDERSCKNYDASTDHRFQRRNCPDGTIFDRTLNRCVSNAAGSNCQQSIIQRDLEWKNIAIGLACRVGE